MVISDERVGYIARIAHEINRAYCEAIGDTSQVPWEEAKYWQKSSAVVGVHFVRDNPDSTPEQCHENWVAEKIEDGWVYGPEKDEEKKEHPCLKPYDELPQAQRVKDHLFRTVVKLLSE